MRRRHTILTSLIAAAGTFALAAFVAGCSEEAPSPDAGATPEGAMEERASLDESAPGQSARDEAAIAEAVVDQAVAANAIGVEAIDDFIAQQTVDKTNPQWKSHLQKPPQVSFDERSYYWDLDTSVGKITVRLMPEVAPMHVSSTIYLTRLGFYDDLVFHRVIPDFMAQGGDPLGNGRGNPGYRYDGEFDAEVVHDRPGLLSMANSGPGTDGSQFFITFVATPHLNGRHTIFGEVTDGMDSVKKLEAWRARGSEHLNDPLVIEKAEIRVE
jgi:cyclophilin family peptidyl-prolyl cis-trans isomerase